MKPEPRRCLFTSTSRWRAGYRVILRATGKGSQRGVEVKAFGNDMDRGGELCQVVIGGEMRCEERPGHRLQDCDVRFQLLLRTLVKVILDDFDRSFQLL